MDFESLRAILYNVCTQAKSNENTPHDVVKDKKLNFADRSYGFGRMTDNYPTDLGTSLKLNSGEIITTKNYGMIINYVLQLGAEVAPLNSTVPGVGKPFSEAYEHPADIKASLDSVYAKLRAMDMATLNCRTQCLGGCKSSCLSTCLSECATSCTKTCAATCQSNCKGACKDGCQYSCKGHCQTQCVTSCLASCTGLCYTSCTGSCYTSCTGCRGNW